MIAGCTTLQPTKENQVSNPTIAVITSPTIVPTTLASPLPTSCPPPTNRLYWIKIDPISNVSVGNPVFINGTTNIPEGMELNVLIEKDQFRALPHYEPPHVSGIVKIIKMDRCTNKFSFYSNTTDLGGPNLFDVSVWTEDTHLSGYNFPVNRSVFYIISQVNP